jgi:hypothetical protein
VPGEYGKRQLLPEVLLNPSEKRGEGRAFSSGWLVHDELCLAACAFKGHHYIPSHLSGHLCAQILPHEVEAKIETRRRAG